MLLWSMGMFAIEIVIILMTVGTIILLAIFYTRFRKNKIKEKTPIVVFSCALAILCTSFVGLNIYVMSHKTYYKYNDWYVKGNNIDKIQEKYGEFDYNNIHLMEAGYCDYPGDGFFYVMKYDSSGIVYEIHYSTVL